MLFRGYRKRSNALVHGEAKYACVAAEGGATPDPSFPDGAAVVVAAVEEVNCALAAAMLLAAW